MRSPLIVALVLMAALRLEAAQALGEQVNARASDYERRLHRAFAGVVVGLDQWVEQQKRAAISGLASLMASCQGLDRRFVAHHLLRLDPAHALARAEFDGHPQGAPFDTAGRELSGWSLGGVVADPELAARVAALIHPPFDVVRDVVAVTSPVVASYWDAQRSELQALKTDLLALKQDPQADLVFQMLAYYYPQSKDVVAYYRSRNRRVPTSRWWIDHIDQYLLDHELAGVDCLAWKPKVGSAPSKSKDGFWTLGSSSWSFPSCVRALRVEAILSCSGVSTPIITLTDGKARGVSVMLSKTAITALELPTRKAIAEVPAPAVVSTAQTPLDVEIRDRRLRISVGGLVVIDQEVSSAHAYTTIAIDGRSAPARQMRVRFIGAGRPQIQAPPAASAPPAEKPVDGPVAEPWVADRAKDLDRVVSAAFNDTPVDEVVAFLAKVSGTQLSLDESGALLKELPVTLTANDMRLGSVLDCLERLADLAATPTATGFTLSWKH
ncbi:MAG: hypothetical protein H0V44_04185 [Planctomycetes bacterium]|nr:hypothetical protein [Planctomycetota bacterium]